MRAGVTASTRATVGEIRPHGTALTATALLLRQSGLYRRPLADPTHTLGRQSSNEGREWRELMTTLRLSLDQAAAKETFLDRVGRAEDTVS